LIAYNPLAKGEYCDREYILEHKLDLFKESSVKFLEKEYNKTKGQIILNWEVSQGIVTIPGTSNPKRMEENMDIFDFKMTEEEIESLSTYGKKMKFCGCRRFFGYNIMA
jgi:diketogulonate reductase-like aldo/keto reductase